MRDWKIIYKDHFGNIGAATIQAADYENAVIQFESQFPDCKALIYQ